MRLGDLFARDGSGRRRLTWRELGVLIRQLPPDARTRLVEGQRDGLWGLAEHLQAMTIDELRMANWQRASEGLKASKRPRPPKPIPRPGTVSKTDKNSPERVAKRLDARKRAAARRDAIVRGEIT